MKTVVLLLSIIGLSSSCFCPQIISLSCGCGGGAPYTPFYGGGGGSYQAVPYPGPTYNYPAQPIPGSYAVFYRDLTPFRQPYYTPRSMYPPVPPPPQLPPMYSLPNPRLIRPPPPPRPQPPLIPQEPPQVVVAPTIAPIRVSPAIFVPPVVTTVRPVHDSQMEYEEEEVYEVTTMAPAPVYTETTTFVPPIVYTTTPYTTPSTTPYTTTATVTITPIAAVQDEVVDFEDTEPKKVENKKDDFYYVYYDEKGNKVGDSRSGTTFAPQDIVNEVTTVTPDVITTSVNPAKHDQNYDDVVVEQTAKLGEKSGDVVYEDETVEYEDGTTSMPNTTKQSKRGLGDNQILVSAANNVGEEMGYRNRLVAKGVKTITKERPANRKLHSN